MTDPGWDDERLAAAFRARWERPAPDGLEPAIRNALAVTEAPNRRRLFSRFSPLTRLAAAALAIVIGSTAIGLGAFDLRGTTPEGSPGLDLTPPTSVLGLDVISVSDVRAIVAANRAVQREIAVEGWYTPAGTLECPPPAEFQVSPVQMRCPDQFEWLTEQPESLVLTTANSETGRMPTSPAFNPDLDDLDLSWQPTLPRVGASGSSTSAHVVFIGHVQDRRARLCPQAELDACLQRFVVDKVAWVDGTVPPLSHVDLLDGVVAQSTPGDIAVIVGDQAPNATILSMVTVDGNPGLGAIEPSLGTGRRGLIDHPALWVVRTIEGTRLETYIVIDGSDAIYRMTADGDALLVGGSFVPAPEPSDGLGTWPPQGSTVLTLPNPVDSGRPPIWVAVVDRSGRLVRAIEPGPGSADLDVSFDDQGSAAVNEPDDPKLIHLFWRGSLCDNNVVIEIGADLRTVAIQRLVAIDEPPKPCPEAAVGRQIVLEFDAPVDAAGIEILAVRSTTRTELDCGPLDPATCDTSAAKLFTEYSDRDPTIVSITFRGLPSCIGSDVTFSDGTGISSDTDCIGPRRRDFSA